jgi:hypothetical protein
MKHLSMYHPGNLCLDGLGNYCPLPKESARQVVDSMNGHLVVKLVTACKNLVFQLQLVPS